MRRWLHIVVPLAILIFSIGLRGADPFLLHDGRLKIFDLFQVLKPRPYVPVPVRLIDLDDESLARLGQWPWPRNLVARLVSRLRQAGAAVIAFDIVFAEPDRASPNRVLSAWSGTPEVRAQLDAAAGALPDYDQDLAEEIGQGRVVTGFILTDGDPGRAPAAKASFATAGDDPRLFVAAFTGAVTNLAAIGEAGAGNGSLNILPERDNVVRSAPLLVAHQGKLYPSLAMEALRVAQGAKTYVVKSSGASRTQAFGAHTGVSRIKVGSFAVPTDAMGRLLLYDTGNVPARTLPAWRVLADDFDPSAIEGIIAIIGTSAAGLKDLRATPLNPAAAGAEVQVQVVEQILLQTFLLRPDWADGAEIGYLFLLGVFLIILLPRLGAAWCALIGGGTIATAIVLSWYAFADLGMLFDPVYPSLMVLAVYMSSSLIGYLRTEAEKQQVRSAFSHYLSPTIVERLAADPSQLKLGGERRDMTLLFCDIRGFTTISEQFDAEGLTRLINKFLTPMTEIIMEREGTIDKYMGDCIMAFWNAPLEDSDHARHACETALAMSARLGPLNDELRAEAEAAGRDHIPIKIGIGINSGEVCVGNMGSDQRFDYSVLGDAVNLAARLEGQSKTYGVGIVIGENSRVRAPDMAALELDLIQVQGKTSAVRIFALLGDGSFSHDGAFRNLTDAHDRMLGAYRKQDWRGARERLESCRGLDNGLGLGALYDLFAQRISDYEQAPPSADWDGVFIATTK